MGGGVTRTLGEIVTRLFPLSTELLFPPRLQEVESDFDGVAFKEVELMLLDAGLPSEVPPLMTVVVLGVGGRFKSS